MTLLWTGDFRSLTAPIEGEAAADDKISRSAMQLKCMCICEVYAMQLHLVHGSQRTDTVISAAVQEPEQGCSRRSSESPGRARVSRIKSPELPGARATGYNLKDETDASFHGGPIAASCRAASHSCSNGRLEYPEQCRATAGCAQHHGQTAAADRDRHRLSNPQYVQTEETRSSRSWGRPLVAIRDGACR